MAQVVFRQGTEKVKLRPTRSIVCVSSTRWDFLWQRPQQLMSRLGREYRVLYVDPPVRTVGAARVPKSGSLRSVTGNIRVLIPYLTDSGSQKTGDYEKTLKEMILRALGGAGTECPLLWIYNPQAVRLGSHFPGWKVLYDCVDSFRAFSWSPPETEDWDRELTRKADLVLTSAQQLYEERVSLNPNTYLVLNAADYGHFTTIQPEPVDIRAISHPRLGFVGAIYEWLDFGLLEKIALSRPQWNLVLLGPVQSGLKLPQARNLHYLGTREYKTLPGYLHNCDLMLIPFLKNETTEHANPIKLWEYLAAGKPVVTTKLPEIPELPGVVWQAENHQMFLSCCEQIMELLKKPARMEEIQRSSQTVARVNSWEARCEQIKSILRQHFG